MRKYRLLNGKSYSFYTEGEVYEDSYKANSMCYNVGDLVKIYPKDWQEVTEPTLSERIQELKVFAKTQGMECDVVVSEVKKVEVFADSFDLSSSGRMSFSFVSSELIKKDVHYLAIKLAKYLQDLINNE